MYRPVISPRGKLLFKWDPEKQRIEIVRRSEKLQVDLHPDGGVEVRAVEPSETETTQRI